MNTYVYLYIYTFIFNICIYIYNSPITGYYIVLHNHIGLYIVNIEDYTVPYSVRRTLHLVVTNPLRVNGALVVLTEQ